MRPSWWPPRIFKTFSWGRFGHPRAPLEWKNGCAILGKRLRRPQDRSTAFLQWIMSKTACVDCKYAVNLAVARDTVNMQRFWPAAIDGAPSGHPRTTSMPQNTFSKKSLNLTTTFWELFCPHRRGDGTPQICNESSWRASSKLPLLYKLLAKKSSSTFVHFSTWLRDTVNMQ